MQNADTSEQSLQNPAALHQPYSWLAPHLAQDSAAKFVVSTMDICHGIHACLEMVNSSILARAGNTFNSEAEAPLLEEIETERLLRFAMASASQLAEAASSRIQLLNAQR